MDGRTVVVTGATRGIGRDTARALAGRGLRTFLVARDPVQGTRTVDELRAATGNPEVHLVLADLSRQRDVRRAAEELRARLPRLDVLVNNAAAVHDSRQMTEDGVERTWAVNQLAPFLLTHLLLDRLLAAVPARVVMVSSSGHKQGRIHLDDLHAERRYRGFRRYRDTKLANLLTSLELARRLDGSGVTVHAVHPGFVPENFPIPEGRGRRFFLGVSRPWSRSSEEAAQRVVHAATAAHLEHSTGTYLVDDRPTAPSRTARDAALARRVWDISAAQTGVGQLLV